MQITVPHSVGSVANGGAVTSATIRYSQTGTGELGYGIISGPTPIAVYLTCPCFAEGASPVTIDGFTVRGSYIVRFRKSANGIGYFDVFQDINIETSEIPTGANAITPQVLGCNMVMAALTGNHLIFGEGIW